MKWLPWARAGFLGLALALILHGWFGPQFAPKNLTSLFVWVHYRGLLVFTLLVSGNLFCGVCPLVFVRDLFRRIWTPRWNWPRLLRNKWLASVLMVVFLYSYERFSFWSNPGTTAVVLVAYFVMALAVDLTFKKASFCQFVCPVGQFNFLASLISPFSVNAKNLEVCRSCVSKACLKGTASQRGCELGLFVPKKSGNWNCTFCMDCARACPHDNVTVSSTGEMALATGRFWQRGDITALIFVFTFGALFNAFAMVHASQVLTLPGTALLILLMVPAGFLMLSEVWNKLRALAPSTRLLAPALIPLGFSIWFGHYIFHFLTGALTFIPVLVSLWPGSDVDPMIWAGFPMGVPLPVVAPFQQGALVVGAVAGLFIAQRRARTFVHDRALAFAIPWHILIVGLSIFAYWIFSLPMDMRGTFVGS